VQQHGAILSAHDRWTRAALLGEQRTLLDSLLAHAASASPYYRDTIGAAVRAGAPLESLPILTKRTLMDQWDRIVTDPQLRLRDVEAHLASERRAELFRDAYRTFATGGTSGERAVIVYDRDAWLSCIASVIRALETAGVGPDTRLVGIGAPTALHVTNRAFAELRSGRSDAPRLSVLTPMPELVDKLNAYQPEMLLTYPSFVRRLVEEQEAGRLRIRPRLIASTAEVLEAEVRHRARDTWGARVIDSYGTTEGGLLGTECDAANGIHVSEDLVVFEVVDESNRRVPDLTQGSRLLITNLFNRTLPLIRYEFTDLVTLETNPCACGRPYARVLGIEGRREDYLSLRAAGGGSVRIHVGRLRGPLIAVAGLRQFQVVANADRVTVRLSVRNESEAPAVLAAAIEAANGALRAAGADVSVAGELVTAIERTGTGAKEKLVVHC